MQKVCNKNHIIYGILQYFLVHTKPLSTYNLQPENLNISW